MCVSSHNTLPFWYNILVDLCRCVFNTCSKKVPSNLFFFSSFLMLICKTTLYISNRFTAVIPFDQ